MRFGAKRSLGTFGYPALSGWCIEGMTAQEIAREVGTGRLPHDAMRGVPAGELREGGYEVIWKGRQHHVQIKLDALPTEKDVERLNTIYPGPECNPVAESKVNP